MAWHVEFSHWQLGAAAQAGFAAAWRGCGLPLQAGASMPLYHPVQNIFVSLTDVPRCTDAKGYFDLVVKVG